MEENQTSSNVDYTFQLEPVSSGSAEAEGEPAGKRTNHGGITCCVPQCYNSNKRNKDLSFYVIPNKKIYPELLKKWLNAISRKNFDDPSEYHRVCSMHFAGGKKTYTNNIPTIVPKFLKPTQHKNEPLLIVLAKIESIFRLWQKWMKKTHM